MHHIFRIFYYELWEILPLQQSNIIPYSSNMSEFTVVSGSSIMTKFWNVHLTDTLLSHEAMGEELLKAAKWQLTHSFNKIYSLSKNILQKEVCEV